MNNHLHPQLPRTRAQWPACSSMPSSHPWLPIRYSPKSCVTLNPSWATPATRPSSSDHGSLPKEKGQGETCLGGVQQGRVAGGASAGLGSLVRGLLKDQAVGPAVAKRSTELSVGWLLLAGSSQCSMMCTREECQCKDRGRGISGAKISSQAPALSKSLRSLPPCPNRASRTATLLRVQLKRECKYTDMHENVLRLFLREHLLSVLLAKVSLRRKTEQAEFFVK